MVWATFTDDFNWRASKRGMIQYRKGQRVNVPRRCAEQAKAEGKATTEKFGRKADADDTSGDTAPEVDDNQAEAVDAG